MFLTGLPSELNKPSGDLIVQSDSGDRLIGLLGPSGSAYFDVAMFSLIPHCTA